MLRCAGCHYDSRSYGEPNTTCCQRCDVLKCAGKDRTVAVLSCVHVYVCVHLVEALLVKLGVFQSLADVCLVVKGLVKRLQASRWTAVTVKSGLVCNRVTHNYCRYQHEHRKIGRKPKS